MLDFFNSYENLTVTEQKALKYIIDHLDEIPFIQINELAYRSFVSKTIIINLSQKLGFAGFREFKFAISNHLLEEKEKFNEKNYSVKESLEYNIDKSLLLISEQDIEACADLLMKAHNIFIMARGTSKSTGYYLEHLLFSLGMHCFFINDYNLSETFTRLVTDKDVVIFISLSGETKKILETAKKVRMNNAKIISMTGFQVNSLNRYSDYSLFAYTDSSNTQKEDSISRIGFFILVDLIIGILRKKRE